MEARVYLGTGLQYPITLPNGKGVLVSDIELINQSIDIILSTPIGTRLFLPEFGSRISEVFFEPNDSVLTDYLVLFIHEALAIWETRIKVLKVQSVVQGTEIVSTINYRVLSSNEVASYIYPFYKKIQY